MGIVIILVLLAMMIIAMEAGEAGAKKLLEQLRYAVNRREVRRRREYHPIYGGKR